MWSERVGFVAALATLKEMEKTKSFNQIIKNGKYINMMWMKLSKKYNLNLRIKGFECITSFEFPKNNQIYKTFISQEMLKKGYLASNLIYLSTKHTKNVIDNYIQALDKVFYLIKKNKIKVIKSLLKGPISKKTFKRLN